MKIEYALECYMINPPKPSGIWRMENGKPESCILTFRKIKINTDGANQIVDILNQLLDIFYIITIKRKIKMRSRLIARNHTFLFQTGSQIYRLKNEVDQLPNEMDVEEGQVFKVMCGLKEQKSGK